MVSRGCDCECVPKTETGRCGVPPGIESAPNTSDKVVMLESPCSTQIAVQNASYSPSRCRSGTPPPQSLFNLFLQYVTFRPIVRRNATTGTTVVGVVPGRCRRFFAFRLIGTLRSHLRMAGCIILAATCVFVLLVSLGCNKNRAAPEVLLTIIDQSWVDRESQAILREELSRFTEQTGIRVQIMPAPEVATDQLKIWRDLLESGAKVPDVYGIDVIWPGILADNLIDLKAYVPEQEIAAHFPELIKNNTVNGRLVALPYNFGEGILFYRADLLQKYGYTGAPKTWEDLEKMAKRIHDGERAKGSKDFWGYVWQGAPSEALTCNALEWQVAEGGGTILEDNGRPTVNNPAATHAWDRAARWIGSISPPGVLAYKEWDDISGGKRRLHA